FAAPNAGLGGSALTVRASLLWSNGFVSNLVTLASGATAVWSGGDLEGQLVVSSNATLAISNTVSMTINDWNYLYTNASSISNYGTVLWANDFYGFGRATIYNAGLWQDTGAHTLISYTGTNVFINAGTFQRVTNGTSVLQWA